MGFQDPHELEMERGDYYYSQDMEQRFVVLAGPVQTRPASTVDTREYKILWDDGVITDEFTWTIGPASRVEALYRASGVREALYRAREVLS